MLSILYHRQSFSKTCDLVPTPCINFFRFFNCLMSAHVHYISHNFLNMRISQSFHSNLIHDKGSLGGTLFALVNFHTLCYTITIHLTCVFSLLVNDIYIVGHVSNVVVAFLCLQAKISTLGFFIQSTKCVTWSSHELNLSTSLSLG